MTAAPVLLLTLAHPRATPAVRAVLDGFGADLLPETGGAPTRAVVDGLRLLDLPAATAAVTATPGVARVHAAWAVAFVPGLGPVATALSRSASSVLDVHDGAFGTVRYALFPTRRAALRAVPCA